jgi:hypothetical protein
VSALAAATPVLVRITDSRSGGFDWTDLVIPLLTFVGAVAGIWFGAKLSRGTLTDIENKRADREERIERQRAEREFLLEQNRKESDDELERKRGAREAAVETQRASRARETEESRARREDELDGRRAEREDLSGQRLALGAVRTMIPAFLSASMIVAFSAENGSWWREYESSVPAVRDEDLNAAAAWMSGERWATIMSALALLRDAEHSRQRAIERDGPVSDPDEVRQTLGEISERADAAYDALRAYEKELSAAVSSTTLTMKA